MKKKYIIFLMQILTSICMVSVGFASWTFVSGDSITASGNIKAEDVISNNEYIKLTNQTTLKYYKSGFVTEENKISLTGSIDVEYTINLTYCNSLYSDFDSLKVIMYLDSNIYNIFEDTTVSCIIENNEGEVITPAVTPLIDETRHNLEFDLYNILKNHPNGGEYKIKVTYSFTVESYELYESNIYPRTKN